MPVINPIEHSAMAPKSLTTSLHTVSKIHRLEMAEAQAAETMKSETKKRSEQTVSAQKSEYQEYRYDQKDESKNDGYQGGRQKKEKHPVDDEDDVAAKIGKSFDIRI